MNIMTVINKLKAVNMVANTEDSIALFSDCFNKFGISILLLNDESKFNQIVDLLKEKAIPLQKANGIYALRIFAVPYNELTEMIASYEAIGELDFIRMNPEKLAERKNSSMVLETMKRLQSEGKTYKNQDGYDMRTLLGEIVSPSSQGGVYAFLQNYLNDQSLIGKLENMEANKEEENANVALELQKVENKICEEYLLPVDDGWKVVINNKEVNSFQEIKNTIRTITELNLPITYHDALILVLFYKTHLSEEEVDSLVKLELLKGAF